MDTFAWIEYFAGTIHGEKTRPYVEGGDAITPSIVIAEFTDKYEREGIDPEERLSFIKTKSSISQLDESLAEAAGSISARRRKEVRGWGIVDSIVLATARKAGAKIVTGDEHFRDLPEAIMIK